MGFVCCTVWFVVLTLGLSSPAMGQDQPRRPQASAKPRPPQKTSPPKPKPKPAVPPGATSTSSTTTTTLGEPPLPTSPYVSIAHKRRSVASGAPASTGQDGLCRSSHDGCQRPRLERPKVAVGFVVENVGPANLSAGVAVALQGSLRPGPLRRSQQRPLAQTCMLLGGL